MQEKTQEAIVIENQTPSTKVYVRMDTNKIIKEVGSSNFIQDLEGWIEIDEGYGDKYGQAQGNYLEKGLIDEEGRYNYKYNNALVELSEEEKNMIFPSVPPQPTEVEVLKTKLDFATKQLEQQEELIVELAMKVYQ